MVDEVQELRRTLTDFARETGRRLDSIDTRLAHLERGQHEVDMWRAREEGRDEGRLENRGGGGSTNIDWAKVTLAALGLVASLLTALAAKGGF